MAPGRTLATPPSAQEDEDDILVTLAEIAAADERDRLALSQRPPESEPEPPRQFRAQCSSCKIWIGAGYRRHEIWLDLDLLPATKKKRKSKPTAGWICEGCASRLPHVIQLATTEEVTTLSLSELYFTCRGRMPQ